MPEYLGDALFELRANVAPLRAGMMEAEGIVSRSTRRMQGELSRNIGGFSRGLGTMGHQLTRTITFPILGIGAAAGKMAIDFQAAMENIHTQAGASQREVDKLSQKVLALAKTVPFGPTPLADALYHLESIGLRLNKQFEQQGIQTRKQIPLMQVLKAAAQGAAVGHADLEKTTTALGSAWLSGIKGASNLKETMGALNAIVGTGNMRMSDLVGALGTGILPMAKLAGLSLKDVGAALAVFSDEGYPAASAATQMATALHYLYDPTKKADAALKGINISHTQLAEDMHKPNGLLVALTDLHDHLQKLPGGSKGVKAESVLGDIFPAGRGRVLTVLMNQLTNYQAKIGQVGTNQAKFTDDVRKTQETAAYKIHQAWASIQSDLTSFGEHVLPPLVDGIKGVAGEIDKVGRAFGKLSPETQKAIITGGLVAAAVGPAMRVASFFVGGLGKLLSAATIAQRLAGGAGWRQAFGGSGTAGTGTTTGGGLADIAEMNVNRMMVAELVAKSIPGVGGTSSRVPAGVASTVASASTREELLADTAPSVPPGYVYDPMLGRNIKVATPRAAAVVATPTEVARASQPRYVPTAGPTSSTVFIPPASGGRSFEQTLAGELQAEEAAAQAATLRAMRQAANLRPLDPVTKRFMPMARTIAARTAQKMVQTELASTETMAAGAAQLRSTNIITPNMRTRAGALAGGLIAQEEVAAEKELVTIGGGRLTPGWGPRAYGPSSNLPPNLRGAAARTSGRLTPQEAFAQAYPQGRMGITTGVVTAERDAAALAAAEAKPSLLSRMFGGTKTAGLAAGAGIAAGAKGVGEIASRAMGGLMIGMTGYFASDMIGNAVKGSVGSAIKDIGKDASIGAGIGSMFGPEGTAGGAILGGLVGTFTHFFKHYTPGERAAQNITRGGFGGAQAPQLAHTISSAVDEMGRLTAQTHTVMRGGGRAISGVQVSTPFRIDPNTLSVDQQAKYMKAAYAAGHGVASQLQKGWDQYKFPDEPTMFVQLRGKLADLPPAAQGYGVQSAVRFARGLEKEGRLAPGSAKKMLQQVEREFPAFARYLGLQGTRSVQQFTKTMDFKDAEKNVRDTLNTVAYKDFPQVQAALELTRGSVATKSGAVIRSLQGIERYGTGPMRKAAAADIAAIRKSWTRDLTASAAMVEQKSKDMATSIQNHSGAAEAAATTNFSKLATNIGAAMAAGVVNVNAGMTLLANAANATLVAFGGTKVPLPFLKHMTPKDLQIGVSTPQGRSALQNYGGTTKSGTGTSYAGGGLIQVGRQGERGRDTVPLNVGGMPIVVGKGEQVAVLTGDQQRFLNARLSDMGGLPGMFGAVDRPHYAGKYATGGIVTASQYGGPGDPGTGSVGYKGDNLYQHPNTYAELNMGTALGHLPYMTPLTVGYHGRNARLFKRDIGAGGPGIGGHPRAIDLWFQAAEALGFSGLGLVSVASAGKANVNISGGVGGAAPRLHVPQLEGKGLIADAGRAQLKKATKQVNDYLSSHVMTAMAGGGSAIPIAGLPQGVGVFDGKPVDEWIIPILTWARSHGWGGSVNSGYRNAAEQLAAARGYGLSKYGPAGPLGSNHLKPSYPGGAVDVSDAPGLAAVLTKYPGKPNLVWAGPVIGDEAHFSATGHALGGVLEATTGASLTNLKPGKKPKKQTNPQQVLTDASQKVTEIENDLTIKLAQYDAISGRYSTDEGQAQYLNDDGSLNPAGVTKKTTDDTDLLMRAQHILADYQAELKPVVNALKLWLGAKSKTQSKIDADNKKLKPIVAKLAGLKTAETALSKPTKDEVTPLEQALSQVRHHWAPILEADEKAQKEFKPEVFHATPIPAKASKAEKARIAAANTAGRAAVAERNRTRRGALSDAVTLDRSTRDNAINPLNNALDAARKARKHHSDQTKASRYAIRVERDTLTTEKANLTKDISGLKAIMTGAGGQEGEDKRIANLETVGGKLGVLEWNNKGKFLGIDTTQQGAAYDEQTTVDSLKITLGQDATLQQPSTTADDSQALADAQALAQYWQNIAMQNAQEAYVAEHQLGTIGGVAPNLAPYQPGGARFSAYQQLPPYAGSFATGGIVPGPIGAPMTAIVHGQEKITPPDASGGNVHLHFANGMDWLKDYVSASVEDSTRGMARRAARRMPSQGGGIVYAR